MKRSLSRTRKALPVAVLLTLVVALLPATWLESRPVRSVVEKLTLPFTPLQHGASLLAAWIRPVRADLDPERSETSVSEVYQEMEDWRQRYLGAKLRIQELEEQLEQLQRLPVEGFDVPVRPINARITGQNPKAPLRAVELNRGRHAGVEPGTVAVFDGIHLVGRISECSSFRSVLVPIVSPATGLLRARVAVPDLDIVRAPEIQLEAAGDGTLVADVDRDLPIEPGYQVLLADGGWPQPAQAMVIGVVESVKQKDEQPLRNRVVVRPRHELHRLYSVTLVLQMPDQRSVADGGAGRAGGGPGP